MTADSIMNVAGTWCNKFGKEQLKAILKDVQYNPKSNFNLFNIEKAIKEVSKLSGDQENLVLTKDSAKLVLISRSQPKMVEFSAHTCRENMKSVQY